MVGWLARIFRDGVVTNHQSDNWTICRKSCNRGPSMGLDALRNFIPSFVHVARHHFPSSSTELLRCFQNFTIWIWAGIPQQHPPNQVWCGCRLINHHRPFSATIHHSPLPTILSHSNQRKDFEHRPYTIVTWQLLIFGSVIRSGFSYGLETLHVADAMFQKIDAFQKPSQFHRLTLIHDIPTKPFCKDVQRVFAWIRILQPVLSAWEIPVMTNKNWEQTPKTLCVKHFCTQQCYEAPICQKTN